MSNSLKTKDELAIVLNEKIAECKNLLSVIEEMRAITGKQKLQRKIEAELRFLQKLTKHAEILKEDHIKSTNLYHLSGIVKCCVEMAGVVKILAPFTFDEIGGLADKSTYFQKRVDVDVVADNGNTWVKVVARNPFDLLQASLGAGRFGRKSIVEQLKEIGDCANQNPHMFSTPKVRVCFTAGVTKQLKLLLQGIDVEVIGLEVQESMIDKCESESVVPITVGGADQSVLSTDVPTSELKLCSQIVTKPELNENTDSHLKRMDSEEDIVASNLDDDLNLDSIPADAVLNLDVSTMVAHVSNLTNGHCNASFKEQILSEQARSERIHPVRNVFNNLFRGRKLICCATAYSDFLEILATVGGPSEKERASKMFEQVTVVPDDPSEKSDKLQDSSRIKKRSRIVFGTGDNLKAVTITANFGFVRSTQSQGIKFVAFVHESRALTEQKELPDPSKA